MQPPARYNVTMDWLEGLLRSIVSWGWPAVVVIAVVSVVFTAIRRTVPSEPGTRILRQLMFAALVATAIVALLLMMPFSNETRGQLLSLLGLVVTAMIALSSTTFVSNAMAGFMLRAVASFHPGDFIRVGEHFGRVTETALFHTEIQSEDRDLVTLPNLFLITQPVRVVRSSGTLVSADVSLGYDVHRRRIADLLKTAAEDAGLSDPFVQTTELGDFSVSYRVSGFLKDVLSMVSKRTELRNKMLDHLHGAGIEIVSPSFMNQRPQDPKVPMMPKRYLGPADEDQPGHAEKLMFDKADVAMRIERFRQQRDELLAELKTLQESEAPEKNEFEVRLRQRQIDSLNEIISALQNEPFEIR